MCIGFKVQSMADLSGQEGKEIQNINNENTHLDSIESDRNAENKLKRCRSDENLSDLKLKIISVLKQMTRKPMLVN